MFCTKILTKLVLLIRLRVNIVKKKELMIKKQEEKSKNTKMIKKKVMKVSGSVASVLKHPQHHKKKHDILSTEKHTLLSTKHAKYTINTTTTTTTSVQCMQASQLITIDYLLTQVKTLKQKVEKNKKKIKHKKKVCSDLFINHVFIKFY
jgi:hypothetical protein